MCKRLCTVRCACFWMTDPLHHQKIIVNSVKWNDTINFELLPNHCFTHHWLLFTYLCSSVSLCVVILLWLCQCDKIMHLAVSLASLLTKFVLHFSSWPIFLYQLLTRVLAIPFRKKKYVPSKYSTMSSLIVTVISWRTDSNVLFWFIVEYLAPISL